MGSAFTGDFYTPYQSTKDPVLPLLPHLERQQRMAQVTGFCSLMLQTQTEFLAPAFSPTHPFLFQHLRSEPADAYLTLSSSLPFSLLSPSLSFKSIDTKHFLNLKNQSEVFTKALLLKLDLGSLPLCVLCCIPSPLNKCLSVD